VPSAELTADESYLSNLFAKKFNADHDASVKTEQSGDISVTVEPKDSNQRLLASQAKELETESDIPFVILSARRANPFFHFQVRIGSDAVARVSDFCY
jgi:tagatose-1,6-bisphosphate aldolase